MIKIEFKALFCVTSMSLLIISLLFRCTYSEESSQESPLFAQNLDSLIIADSDSALIVINKLSELYPVINFKNQFALELLEKKITIHNQKGEADSSLLSINQLGQLYLTQKDTAKLIPLLTTIDFKDVNYSYIPSLIKWLEITVAYTKQNEIKTTDATILQNLLASALIETNQR